MSVSLKMLLGLSTLKLMYLELGESVVVSPMFSISSVLMCLGEDSEWYSWRKLPGNSLFNKSKDRLIFKLDLLKVVL